MSKNLLVFLTTLSCRPSEFAEISQKCLPRIADGEGHGSFNQSHIAQQLARYAKSSVSYPKGTAFAALILSNETCIAGCPSIPFDVGQAATLIELASGFSWYIEYSL